MGPGTKSDPLVSVRYIFVPLRPSTKQKERPPLNYDVKDMYVKLDGASAYSKASNAPTGSLSNIDGLRKLKSYRDTLDAMVQRVLPIPKDPDQALIRAQQTEELQHCGDRLNYDYFTVLPKVRNMPATVPTSKGSRPTSRKSPARKQSKSPSKDSSPILAISNPIRAIPDIPLCADVHQGEYTKEVAQLHRKALLTPMGVTKSDVKRLIDSGLVVSVVFRQSLCSGDFTCKYCEVIHPGESKTFTQLMGLRNHIFSHFNFFPFHCTDCDFKTMKKVRLNIHRRQQKHLASHRQPRSRQTIPEKSLNHKIEAYLSSLSG